MLIIELCAPIRERLHAVPEGQDPSRFALDRTVQTAGGRFHLRAFGVLVTDPVTPFHIVTVIEDARPDSPGDGERIRDEAQQLAGVT